MTKIFHINSLAALHFPMETTSNDEIEPNKERIILGHVIGFD